MTWCVPVLMQGAEIRELTQGPERGCQPARPAASGPVLGLTCLFLPGRYLGLMLLSVEELGISQLSSLTPGREALNPHTPPPVPTVSCSGPNASLVGAVHLRGRALEVDVDASQALDLSGVTGPGPGAAGAQQEALDSGFGTGGAPRGGGLGVRELVVEALMLLWMGFASPLSQGSSLR